MGFKNVQVYYIQATSCKHSVVANQLYDSMSPKDRDDSHMADVLITTKCLKVFFHMYL